MNLNNGLTPRQVVLASIHAKTAALTAGMTPQPQPLTPNLHAEGLDYSRSQDAGQPEEGPDRPVAVTPRESPHEGQPEHVSDLGARTSVRTGYEDSTWYMRNGEPVLVPNPRNHGPGLVRGTSVNDSIARKTDDFLRMCRS